MKCINRECKEGKIMFEKMCTFEHKDGPEQYGFPCSVCGLLHVLRGDEEHKNPAAILSGDGSGVFCFNGEIENKPVN